MKRNLITAIALLLFMMPLQVSANDGYSGGVGETPMPRNSKDIIMEKEVVHVILHEGQWDLAGNSINRHKKALNNPTYRQSIEAPSSSSSDIAYRRG